MVGILLAFLKQSIRPVKLNCLDKFNLCQVEFNNRYIHLLNKLFQVSTISLTPSQLSNQGVPLDRSRIPIFKSINYRVEVSKSPMVPSQIPLAPLHEPKTKWTPTRMSL